VFRNIITAFLVPLLGNNNPSGDTKKCQQSARSPYIIIDVILDDVSATMGLVHQVPLWFLTPPLEILVFGLEISLHCLELLFLLMKVGSPPARAQVWWCGLGAPVASGLAHDGG
jgi:hypothetical protein